MKYIYTKNLVNSDRLATEIKANSSVIATLQGINWSAPSRLEIEFSPSLTAEEAIIVQGIVNAHSGLTTSDIVKDRILKAMEFGKELMADYATKRVVRGAGVADTERVLNKLGYIQTSLLAGSLYVALDQLNKLAADSDVPQSDIDEFKLRISKYLGL